MKTEGLPRWALGLGLFLLIAAWALLGGPGLKPLPLSSVHWPWLLPLILIKMSSAMIAGLRLKLLLGIYGVKLSFYESLGLSSVAVYLGYLTPAKAGTLVRILYLKKRYSMKLADQIISMSGNTLLELLYSSAICILVIFITDDWNLFSSINISMDILIKGPFVVIALFLLILISVFHITNKYNIVSEFLQDSLKAFRILLSEWKHFISISILVLSSLIIKVLALNFSCMLLEVMISLSTLILVATLANILVMIPSTPGSLGITEGAIIALLAIKGIDVHTSTLIAFVSRLASLSVQIPLGILFSMLFFGSWRNISKNLP